MKSDERTEEIRRAAKSILALTPEQVSHVFHEEMKKRKLGKLIRHLDQLVLSGGDDGHLATRALNRLGFSTLE